MQGAAFFAPDYLIARQRFLESARQLGSVLLSHTFAARGPAGEPLTMDVATLGDPDPERVVIVSSGLHGVEGFLGSAIQLAWLQSQKQGKTSLPPRTAIVLAHALNPYGFAWVRRANENNVDLNRNFLADRSFLTNDPAYQAGRSAYNRLDPLLNPPSPPSRFELYTLRAALHVLRTGFAARGRLPPAERPFAGAIATIAKLGIREFQKTLPVGQYEHPQGLFYGGAKAEETTLVLMENLPQWMRGARSAVHLDFHTGLGRFADYRLLVPQSHASPQFAWAAEYFGQTFVEPLDGKTAYPARGSMAAFFRDRFPNLQYDGLLAEFGTYSGLRVLGALRAENRAHFYDRPGSSTYRWAKRQLLEAFCPASPRWRSAVVAKGLAIIAQALQACGR